MLRAADDAVTLSWKTRLICFGVCLGVGMILSFLVGTMYGWVHAMH